MSVLITPFLVVIRAVLDLAYFTVILYAIVETLFAFGVLNVTHQRLCMLHNLLCDIIEPFLAPIRKRIPFFYRLDLSTLILMLIILFFRVMVSEILMKF